MGSRLAIGISLAYFAILELMLGAAILYWPNFNENMGAFKLIAPLPMLRDMVGQLEQGGVAAYTVSQHFFKGCNTLGTLAAVLFGSAAVAGESYRGTLEIWLARPLTRTRILTERYLFYAAILILPVFASTATIPLFLDRIGENLNLVPLLVCAAHQSLFLLALFSLTFFLSVIGRNPISVASFPLFLSTLTYSIYFVKTVTHYSVFRTVDISAFMRIYKSGQMNWHTSGWFIGTTVLFFAFAQYAFRRRLPV